MKESIEKIKQAVVVLEANIEPHENLEVDFAIQEIADNIKVIENAIENYYSSVRANSLDFAKRLPVQDADELIEAAEKIYNYITK